MKALPSKANDAFAPRLPTLDAFVVFLRRFVALRSRGEPASMPRTREKLR